MEDRPETYSIPSSTECLSNFRLFLTTALCLFASYTTAQDIQEMAEQRPVTIRGSLEARAMFYDANGIANRFLPSNYLISGSPVLSLYGIDVPVYFSFSRQQSSFTQPFNQFGLSPHYKWLTVHAGYRNLHYSSFTLADHTFLGGGIDLKPGKWRISAMYGRFNKATPLDTVRNLYIENFAYRRTGFAVRAGYGSENNFFELISLKARDDDRRIEVTSQAWLDSMRITPAENWVTGYRTRFTFLKGKFIFDSDGGLSLYTRDVNAPAIEDSTLRSDVQPFQRFADVNYSSELYGAVQASITYSISVIKLKLQYRLVEPGYTSMGAYFLNNDLENWTIGPTIILANGRVRFTGSLGFQRDNLQDLKRATSRRVIGAGNLSADLTESLGFDLSYTNFSNTQHARSIRFADSLRIAQSTVNLSLSPRYMIANELHNHTVVASLNFNRFEELNPDRSLEVTGNNITTKTYFLTYQIGFLASRSTLYGTLNYAELGNELINDENAGLTIGGSKRFSGGKINLAISSGYLLSNRNGEDGHILNQSLQVRFSPLQAHGFHLNVSYLGNYPEQESEWQRKFTEIRGEVGYTFNF